MKASSYTISKKGIKGLVKSSAIWVHDADSNASYPIAYLRKPKWLSEKSFDQVLDKIFIERMPELERAK